MGHAMHAILALMHHMTSQCYGDPSFHPIGDPDVNFYHKTARSVQSGKLLLLGTSSIMGP